MSGCGLRSITEADGKSQPEIANAAFLGTRAFPCEALSVVCSALWAEPLLAVGAAAKDWHHAAMRDEVWRILFVHRWTERQKPHLVREWWNALLACGAAPCAVATLTAEPYTAASLSGLSKSPAGARLAGDASSWCQRFVLAERDLRRSSISAAELCEDLLPDLRAAAPSARSFPRRWVLVEGAHDEHFLGDEMQFNPDGTVESRSCLLILKAHVDAQWRWAWPPGADGGAIAITSDATTPGGAVQCLLQVERSLDAGFVLRGPLGLVLCSRERTEVEHIFRRYNELEFPQSVQNVISGIVEGRVSTPYTFPESTTSFERLAAHRLADRFGLCSSSRGIGIQRKISVWRVGDTLQ